ncbi:4-hydroxy-tetrahydrodipicolinate reductase [Pelagibacteraceae bacterium]|nr:4-hydroxy-tetrahydrodipicolinate reductase [Pelagibacteraceae bacterium]
MKKINITISGGLGRMGSLLIQKVKEDRSLNLSSVTEQRELKKNGIFFEKNSSQSLKKANVVIDFTRPNCTSQILKLATKLKKKVIIGTTGFNKKQQAEINKASKKIAILQSGNMSLGVNLMQYLSGILSEKILKEYSMEIHDAHHKMKIDYPSGTALMLGNAVAKGKGKSLDQIKGNIFLNKKGKGKANKINFYIKRKGKIPGTHSVIFQTTKETIELKHIAKSRDLFADGAINAAKWLANKKPGLYNMHDVLKIR